MIQLHWIDTDSNMIGLNTKDIIKGLRSLENLFDFSKLNENNQLFTNKNEKVIAEFKIKTPKIFCIDEFNCLRCKMNAIKGGDSSKNQKKGFLNINKKISIFQNMKKV